MPTSTKKPYAPAPASPGSKTSAPCCRTGSPPHSVITAPSTQTGHRPARRAHPSRQLRNPRPTPRTTPTPLRRDIFPHAAAVNRRIDLDHTIPYLSPDKGGPPGQTRIGNLRPYARRHHNYKTHRGWRVRQHEPGTWLWRSPHRRIYLVKRHRHPPPRRHRVCPGDLARRYWFHQRDPNELELVEPRLEPRVRLQK